MYYPFGRRDHAIRHLGTIGAQINLVIPEPIITSIVFGGISETHVADVLLIAVRGSSMATRGNVGPATPTALEIWFQFELGTQLICFTQISH